MFKWLGNLFGGTSAKAGDTRGFRARYDNAATTDENRRNWFGVDYLSAKSANSFQVRKILRTRSRYEVANNPFLFGIVNSNADDLISTGPKLQILTDDDKYNAEVEKVWGDWELEVGFVDKLRTLKVSKTVDGEGFLIFKTAKNLNSPVKLYLLDVEADQVTDAAPTTLMQFWIDGITLDPVTEEPVEYRVLKSHPGDYYAPNMNPLETVSIKAENVVQWFTKFRPGQARGVPAFTSSLDMFNELRSYRKAVLNNAQLAAVHSAVIETEYAPVSDDDDEDAFLPWKRVETERGVMVMLPKGAKMSAFDAKQPQTTYEMFQEKCLAEACRPLNYPLNLALGTSQKFNFSSAKLDHINYRNGLNVERGDCKRRVLKKIFDAWYSEAVLCGAIRPYNGLKLPPHEWHWPGYQSIDPVADAQADHERLSNGTLTYRRYWAREGEFYRDVFKQQAREKREMNLMDLEFGKPTQRSISESTTPEAEKEGVDV
jgi:lambda family phage portal protein